MPKIDSEKFYTPKEIVKLGVMTASSKDTQRQMLLRFIRQGRLKAVNVGTESKERYLVQGKNLQEYLTTQMKKGEYIKK